VAAGGSAAGRAEDPSYDVTSARGPVALLGAARHPG